MSAKIIILIAMCVIGGIGFYITGFYFFRQDNVEIKRCGYIAFAIGAVTCVLGLLIFAVPALAALMVLIYLFFLIIAFLVLYFMFIKKN